MNDDDSKKTLDNAHQEFWTNAFLAALGGCSAVSNAPTISVVSDAEKIANEALETRKRRWNLE